MNRKQSIILNQNWFIPFTILVGLLIGLLISQPNYALSISVLLVVIIAIIIGQHIQIQLVLVERLCCWLVFITGFFGAAFFAIDLSILTLFPFRILILMLWSLFLFHALLSGTFIFSQQRIKYYLIYFGFWLMYAVFSLAWAASTIEALRHIIFLAMGVSVVFFTTYYFRGEKDLKRLFWLWLGAFGILLLIGLWEHLTGQHLSVSEFFDNKRAIFARIPTGVFKNPNDYATFLALSIPFALNAIRYSQGILFRFLGIISIILGSYLIVITGSRGNILAVIFEFAVLWFFLEKCAKKAKWIIVIVAIYIILLALIPTITQLGLKSIAIQLDSLINRSNQRISSDNIRWNLLRNGLLFVYWTAGFGVGAGNSEFWMENHAQYNTYQILNPHNWWLEILINYGIIIFIGYVLLYLNIIRELFIIWKKTKEHFRMICESLFLSLIGFFVACISPSSIMAFNPQWLLFAFALTFLNLWYNSQGSDV